MTKTRSARSIPSMDKILGDVISWSTKLARKPSVQGAGVAAGLAVAEAGAMEAVVEVTAAVVVAEAVAVVAAEIGVVTAEVIAAIGGKSQSSGSAMCWFNNPSAAVAPGVCNTKSFLL